MKEFCFHILLHHLRIKRNLRYFSVQSATVRCHRIADRGRIFLAGLGHAGRGKYVDAFADVVDALVVDVLGVAGLLGQEEGGLETT